MELRLHKNRFPANQAVMPDLRGIAARGDEVIATLSASRAKVCEAHILSI